MLCRCPLRLLLRLLLLLLLQRSVLLLHEVVLRLKRMGGLSAAGVFTARFASSSTLVLVRYLEGRDDGSVSRGRIHSELCPRGRGIAGVGSGAIEMLLGRPLPMRPFLGSSRQLNSSRLRAAISAEAINPPSQGQPGPVNPGDSRSRHPRHQPPQRRHQCLLFNPQAERLAARGGYQLRTQLNHVHCAAANLPWTYKGRCVEHRHVPIEGEVEERSRRRRAIEPDHRLGQDESYATIGATRL
eukprot:scaffold43870_cov66-Phaeocystis_antarctica.AAC.2